MGRYGATRFVAVIKRDKIPAFMELTMSQKWHVYRYVTSKFTKMGP